MIPGDVQNSLKSLVQSQKTLITATQPAGAASGFELGQRYQATVQAQLAPGIFKVQIASQTLQLQLPASIRTGDTITLQVVSLLPRLTFNMAASANPLSTAEQLSETSRLLSALTRQPLEKEPVRAASSPPLWTGSTTSPDPVELAGKLHQALSHSGLFYESHQAQWIAGTRKTTQILQEPQNQPPDEIARALSEAFQHTEEKQQLSRITGIPEHLLALVQQQLHALETRQVQWQGNIWPQQEMRWKIQEEPPDAADPSAMQQWATEIQLTLPKLGEVSALLRFGPGGLSLKLTAAQDQTRDKLGAASAQLVSAMTERGIPVSSALITQHDTPPA